MKDSKSASSQTGESGPDPDPGLERASTPRRWRVPYLRWWIGGLLFASTTINYIDRQTLSVLAPYLKAEKHWTNTDFATIIIAFRISYSFLQFLGGRLVDLVGTRRGLTITVAWYSLMTMLTSLATGLGSFRAFWFGLGIGEAANWPGAIKAVSEWFPAKERGIAVALVDSGAAVGGAIAPALVVWLYHSFGTWRSAFLATGALGFVWTIIWIALYRGPQEHAHITETERAKILTTRAGASETAPAMRVPAAQLLGYRQTWGVILPRAILDPVWFLLADWFALFLVSRGFKMEETLAGFWIPFMCAYLGNFLGGGLSSFFIHRGWSLGAARRVIFLICGPLLLALIPAIYTKDLWLLILEFGLATLGYASCSTIFLVLPSDMFESGSVATVSGVSGMVTGFVMIAVTYSIGAITDRYSFAPILLSAGAAPVLAAIVVFVFVRNTKQTGNGVLLKI